jgi:hypothetical protein
VTRSTRITRSLAAYLVGFRDGAAGRSKREALVGGATRNVQAAYAEGVRDGATAVERIFIRVAGEQQIRAAFPSIQKALETVADPLSDDLTWLGMGPQRLDLRGLGIGTSELRGAVARHRESESAAGSVTSKPGRKVALGILGPTRAPKGGAAREAMVARIVADVDALPPGSTIGVYSVGGAAEIAEMHAAKRGHVVKVMKDRGTVERFSERAVDYTEGA